MTSSKKKKQRVSAKPKYWLDNAPEVLNTADDVEEVFKRVAEIEKERNMTEEEKRQQKAMLLLDYQEAENNLAHLREKAGRVAKPYDDVGTWLGRASSFTYPGYREEDAKRNANIRVNLEAYRKSLNFDEALALMDEIKKAEELLAQLARRKAELGLK